MAQPTKVKKTGMYQWRRRVPDDVYALIGGSTHEKESLGTKGWNEAVRRFKAVDAKREARWAQIRLGVQDLDERQATALAGDLYREMLAKWPVRNWFAMNTWAGIKANCEAFDREFEARFGTQEQYLEGLHCLHGERLDLFLRERGMEVSPSTWHRLLEATHRAVKLGIDQMLRETSGDWTPDRVVEKFPPLEIAAPPDPKQQFEAVWEEYEALVKPKAATVRRWKSALAKMFEALGTTDMSKVTEEMLTDYMNARIKAGIHNNTVGKVDLAAAKRLFRFAKQQRFIASNPAIDVEVSSGAKYETDMRSFHPHEATIILRATLAPPSTKMAPAFAAARRWVPWICAYTGARVNEITQARACDFFVADGMTVLRVTDEAGTAKTGPRNVPLHPDLIDQGFGKFLVTKKGEEPLFYTPREEDTAVIRPFEEMGARLSKWVRKLGITDLTLDPNHAWRHRFKGYSAKAGNDERVTDAIQGHAPGTQGRKYGEVVLEERIAAIRKLPRIDIPDRVMNVIAVAAE